MSKIREFFGKLGHGIAETFRSFPTKENIIKTVCLVLGICILTGISFLAVSGSMVNTTEEKITDRPDGSYDCAIILGAKVKSDGTPSDMLRDRLDTGIALYKNGTVKKLLMSGDGEEPEKYDEVSAMKAYAVAAGVPEADILTDGYGLSTYDSMWRAKKLYGVKNAVIVTQKYHLHRALYIARKLGYGELCGVPADVRTYRGQIFRNLREVAARVKDFFFVRHGHMPEYTE